ncbi:MAG: GNAT family N-acetyltransferase [Gammaproteobacteria bacterium 28-57-27]|nr:MAG: GNAT family N-acetyltransferase [Gammaproteobacteria bacterium 28-57-27]
MKAGILIQKTELKDAPAIAGLVGRLLSEIMDATGVQSFSFDLEATTTRLRQFIERGKYHVLAAWDGEQSIGFLSLYDSYALYAEGEFGTIAEFYVAPAYRGQGLGQGLLNEAKKFGRERGWMRLEVTTPPLPEYTRTLAFYEREGFAVAGGRKMKVLL